MYHLAIGKMSLMDEDGDEILPPEGSIGSRLLSRCRLDTSTTSTGDMQMFTDHPGVKATSITAFLRDVPATRMLSYVVLQMQTRQSGSVVAF